MGQYLVSSSANQPANVYEAGQVTRSEIPGRPSSYLNADNVSTLECSMFLFQHGFKFSLIADMYLVHRTALWRRLGQIDVHSNKYTEMSDEELMTVMKNIQQNHPYTGVSMMTGHLRSNGIVVKQNKS